jgi:hypothetical protein
MPYLPVLVSFYYGRMIQKYKYTHMITAYASRDRVPK